MGDMDIDLIAEFERRLDDYQTRIELLEKAITQLPHIGMQSDPSRQQGVSVPPLPITGVNGG